jgi:spore germination cell wall hydrolase CwlJ-like protein
MPHLKPGAGRIAALVAPLALAAGCTPDHMAKSADVLAPVGRPRAAAPAPARSAAPDMQTAVQASVAAMKPFVLEASRADRTRAVNCLTQAVYYEAAREPREGQEAVAQVVLNRVRHPAYPKSVCGVVYQGSANATGCQFTFTCDGSLRWKPQAALWARAEDVARRALAGYVDAQVGSATHYHAVYVAPGWAPALTRMTQVGQHVFYRWNGAWGEPRAFTGRYAGREAELTPAVLTSGDPKAPEAAPPEPETREVRLTVGAGERTYRVADAAAPGGTRLEGVLQPTRRRPTPEEVRRINEEISAPNRSDAQPAAPATGGADLAEATRSRSSGLPGG